LSAKPPSFWSVVALAVAGAVMAAVVIAALGVGRPPASSPGVTSVAAEPPVVLDSPSASPSALASPSPSASSPSPSPTPSKARKAKASPTPRGSKTPTFAATVLAARYSVSGENSNGFVAGVEVTNPGPEAAAWTVEITYSGNVRVAQVWNATVQKVGNTYRFRANSGAALGASQKAQFGYIASGPRGSSRAVRCTINSRTCG
jgi:hypothetical protein